MSFPVILMILGLFFYLPTWPWRSGELKEIGRIAFFCGLLVLAMLLRGGRFLF